LVLALLHNGTTGLIIEFMLSLMASSLIYYLQRVSSVKDIIVEISYNMHMHDVFHTPFHE